MADAVIVSPQDAIAAAPGGRFYRPELDILRFIAFLGVFSTHAILIYPGTAPHQRIVAPIGAYGMCVFFYLSAFLITELLRREHDSTGTVHIRSFYVRRILRIWPLYFAFLLFGKLVGHLYPLFHLENARLFAFLFLFGNWYLVRHGANDSPVGPLWSISLEEQFYLVWPALTKYLGLRKLLWCTLALLPVAWIALVVHPRSQPAVIGLEFDGSLWCNTFVQFQYFGLGAATALVLRGRQLQLSVLARLAMAALACASGLTASWVFRLPRWGTHVPGIVLIVGYSLVACGCLLLFCSLYGLSARGLPRAIVYLGKISYGLYVFHIFFLECVYLVLRHVTLHVAHSPDVWILCLINYVVAMALTIVAAALSYRYFESPFLRFKQRVTFIQSRAI